MSQRAEEYRKARKESWQEVVLPSNGTKFLVGPIDTIDFVKFQNLSKMAGISREEAVNLRENPDDKDLKKDAAEKIEKSDVDMMSMMDIVIPAMVKEPKILAGNQPIREWAEHDKEAIYVGELDPRDSAFLLKYAIDNLNLEKLSTFRG